MNRFNSLYPTVVSVLRSYKRPDYRAFYVSGSFGRYPLRHTLNMRNSRWARKYQIWYAYLTKYDEMHQTK